jgi:hypothetical protein
LLCTTETVRDEAIGNFPKIVNRYFDRVRVNARIARAQLYAKFRLRLMDLFRSCEIKKVEVDVNRIKAMYRGFSADSDLLKRLKQLQVEKHRKSLFPSENDMRILAEANKLGEKFSVCFITDDNDFLHFKSEIESRLNLRMTALLDVPHYFDS